MNETKRLASYVADLEFTDIPGEVVQRAKECLLDSIAVGLYGSTKPWGKILQAFAKDQTSRGASSVFGADFKASAAAAALANGTMTHGFELDNVRQPGAGVHAGATIVPALFAAAEEARSNGKDLLTAFVGACEAMFRIGVALGHGVEKRGFHAPGLTGTFGAAAAVGKILELNTDQLVSAFGVSGSLSSGILEFSKSQGGGMVKRLHLGRAAEGGVVAASLAHRGFSGPPTVLEGEFGFCRVYSDHPQVEKLTAGLGKEFETLTICVKRYPCHIYAQAPIEALSGLREEHSFSPSDVEKIIVAGEEKLVSHHAIHQPGDVMTAQYSVPYSVALSLFAEAEDPENFSEANLTEPKILDLTRRVELEVDEAIKQRVESRAARVIVKLKNGDQWERQIDHFKGTPQNPMTFEELKRKATLLARHVLAERELEKLIERIWNIEKVEDVSTLLSSRDH